MNTVNNNKNKHEKNEEMSLHESKDITPEDMDRLAKIMQREERMKNDPAYGNAKASKDKSTSAAFKSQERTMAAMGKFYGEVAVRNKQAGYKERIFVDEKSLELATDSSDFMLFCMQNGIIPTWNLYAVWLNVDMSTLYAEENLSSKCSRILKNMRNRIFTILEQSTLQREGNPAAGIFFLKSLWGLSDQQPIDVNVHTDAPRQLSSAEVQNLIDITPDETHETI